MSAPTIPHGSLTPTPDRRLVVLAPSYPKLGGELRDACRDERWVP
jgi:hypothetical protein